MSEQVLIDDLPCLTEVVPDPAHEYLPVLTEIIANPDEVSEETGDEPTATLTELPDLSRVSTDPDRAGTIAPVAEQGTRSHDELHPASAETFRASEVHSAAAPRTLSAEEMQHLLQHLEAHLETVFSSKLNSQLEQLQKLAIELAVSEFKAELPQLLRDALKQGGP